MDASFASALKSLAPIEPRRLSNRRRCASRAERCGRVATPAPAPRDITELLRDFDLPPLPGDARAQARRDRSATARTHAAQAVHRLAPRRDGRARDRRARRRRRHRGARPCASRRRRRSARLSVQTNPPGVAVFVDGVARGNTPARISLERRLAHRRAARPRRAARDSGHRDRRRGSVAVPRAARNAVGRQPARAVGSAGRARQRRRRRSRRRAGRASPISRPASTTSCCRPRAVPPVRQRVVIQAGVTSSVLAPGVDRDAGSRVGLAVGEGAGRDRDPRERPPDRHDRHRPDHDGRRPPRPRAGERHARLSRRRARSRCRPAR